MLGEDPASVVFKKWTAVISSEWVEEWMRRGTPGLRGSLQVELDGGIMLEDISFVADQYKIEASSPCKTDPPARVKPSEETSQQSKGSELPGVVTGRNKKKTSWEGQFRYEYSTHS
jgi:hypothetical protein